MNKVALVTGSGRGLGAHLAEVLAQKGYDLIVHYNSSRTGADQTAQKVKAHGRRCQVIQADLSNPESVRELSSLVESEFGRLDLLINNSGVYHEKSLEELSEDEWFEGLNTTASAVFLLTRAVIPLLRKCKGRVVSIGDSSAERASARNLAMSYHIGKTGVWMLTRSFAQQEASHGVTVNMISPGYLDNSVGLPDPSIVPAGRFGTFDDIASALLFLVQTENTYLTGSNLVVSGGWNLR